MTPSQAQVAALATLPNVAALDATLLNAASVSVDPIVRLYQAVFGRVPDSGGLNYWVGVFAAGTTLQEISSNFASSDEFLSQYAGLTNSEIVGRMYQNVLQRAGDPEGVAFWTNFLNNGGTLAQLVLEFSQSPEFIGNSDPYVDAFLLAAADGEGIYTGSLFELPHVGDTFVLTTAVDNFTGTDGDDTFIGENSTINPADRIDGVEGTDSFDATLTGGSESLHSTNVEIFNLQALSGSPVFNMINVTGATEIWSDNSTSNLTVTNVQEKALVGVNGGDGSDDFTVEFETDAVSGALDVELNNANIEDLQADDGAGTGFETVNVAVTGENEVVELWSGGDIKTLNISGTGSVYINNAINSAIELVDATANSGGVDLNFDNSSDVKVLGGSGDDYFYFDNNFDDDDDVNGGTGRDTLAIWRQQQITDNSKIANVEILEVDGFFGTLDAENVGGLDTVKVTDFLGTATIDNFTSGGTVITPDNGTLFINVKDAATGTADSFTLVVDDGADVGLNTPNVETVTIDNISDNFFGSFIDLDDDKGLQTLIVKSVADSFTDIDQISSGVKLVDGSAALGSLDIVVDAGGAVDSGATIVGGSAADDLTGGDGKDAIIGGAGDDELQGDQGFTIVEPGVRQQDTLVLQNAGAGDVITITINGFNIVYNVPIPAPTQFGIRTQIADLIDSHAADTGGVTANNQGGNIVLLGNVFGDAFTVNVQAENFAGAPASSTVEFASTYDIGDQLSLTVDGVVRTITVGVDTGGSGSGNAVATAFAAAYAGVAAGLQISTAVDGDNFVVTGTIPGANHTVTAAAPVDVAPTPELVTITPTGLDAPGESLVITVGGTAYSEAFDTNLATTLNNFVANYQAAILAQLPSPANVVYSTGTAIVIGDNQGNPLGEPITASISGTGTATAVTTPGVPVTDHGTPNVVNVAAQPPGTNDQSISVDLASHVAPEAAVVGGELNADILTGGEGNNEFVFIGSTFAEFNVIDGTPVDAIDTITDLKLGTDVFAGQQDTINLQFVINDVVNDGVATALVGASLQGAVDVLFQTGGVLNNVANAAGLFTWQGDTYLVAADGAGTDFGGDDAIVKVTGATGVLDTTDFV
ncbi:DUF4214 domain-containing protein [Chelatococcus sp. GCM10030263]|uniref:DUF4214 domain-containing protein n=1 Tax=Chelatococcus sp. GCM10030263 TaxID=3273387 RepID=UPI00361AC272